MRRIYHHNKLQHSMRILVILFLAGVLFWGMTLDPDMTLYNHDPFFTVDTNWVQLIDGASIPLDTVSDAVTPTDGAPIVIERTISDMAQNRSLLFYASHQEVYMYINDELTYSFTCPEALSFLGTPGRSWVEFPIRSDMIGQTLRIEFYSNFALYNDIPSEFYYVTPDDIQLVQVDYGWLRNTMALVIIALAIISYVNASLWTFPKLRRYLFSLADIYLLSGLWLCGEINVLTAWTGNAALSSLMAMIIIRLIPLTYARFVSATAPQKNRWFRYLEFLAWGNLIISMALQLFWGVSLVRTMPLNVAVFAFSSMVYLVNVVVQSRNPALDHTYKQAYWASMLFPVAVMAEVYCYIHQGSTQKLTGLFIATACLIYSLIAHVLLVQEESRTQVEVRELERYQRSLEKKPLFQQINAHFLFNTLNTISAYCKEDPKTADHAVTLLAKYMRSIMHLSNAEDYVPFKKEVDLIQWYMEILNLRYMDKIELELDIGFEDFVLPPLTLQPLVENAVLHGLHNFVSDGRVRIHSRRHGSMVEVVISDNGQGFDPRAPIKHNGLAMKNLTQRITAAGGTLWTESHIGSGTDVTIQIPLHVEDFIEQEAQP